MESDNHNNLISYSKSINNLTLVLAIFLLIVIIAYLFNALNVNFTQLFKESPIKKEARLAAERGKEYNASWKPKDFFYITDTTLRNKLLYGKELISHTAKYLGPRGSVAKITNGMNCQNCHLDAGTKPWGNNYGAVFATYPKYRARSGTKENIYKRINDCVERSLNGFPLSENSYEMDAMKSYIEYIGSNMPKGEKAKSSGIYDLPFLERSADTTMGKTLYQEKCQSCHQANGEGLLAEDKIEYVYPPLWGKNSYNYGAGLYRLTRIAGYIKYNMPQGATYINPQLSDEQAWDIAAYINSQPRPVKDLSKDWPKIAEKPIDHPFGPFADHYSEKQHKFGPFAPIDEFKKKNKSKK